MMEGKDSNFNIILNHIIENSLFTQRQLSIISNYSKGGRKPANMTSGAYYRQVKQCKDKVVGLVYSLVLLRAAGMLDASSSVTIDRLAEQVSVILSVGNSDNLSKDKAEGVISVMDQVIKRMCKV